MRFINISLENWKNFRRVDQRLARRVFLVGPNASGKSNFLDVFRFLRDVANQGLFQAVVDVRGGMSSIRALAARRHPKVVVEVLLGGEKSDEWRYRLSLGQDSQRRPKVEAESVWKNGAQILARPGPEDKTDPERLQQTHLEQTIANREFRKITEFFKSVNYLHLVPQLIRDPDRSVGRVNDPFGGDFVQRIARKNRRTRDAWLDRIKAALQVAVPQFKELTTHRDEKDGTLHLRGLYEHWRPRGAWQTEEQWSDGTLRLLGLLWALLEGSGPLLLEEPELSLHPEVVRHIPQMMARVMARRNRPRQIIISTHSTDLLRDSGIAADEVLLFQPKPEGSEVKSCADISEVRDLLETGLTAAEAAFPHARPAAPEQLTLFGD